MKISIAMGYKDRLPQLDYTLHTISSFKFDGEIIICDDFSKPDQSPKLLLPKYEKLDIKIVYLLYKYTNPCIAYNQAFRACNGDIIIIQNPECFWVGDIASACREALIEKRYLSFACLSVSKENTGALWANQIHKSSLQGNWYSHSKHRPLAFHFCTAILKKDFDEFLKGGFDERFADGYDYDDTEFVYRIRAEHFNIQHIDEPSVVHQWHPKFWQDKSSPAFRHLLNENKTLYESLQKGYSSKEYIGVYPNEKSDK